MSTTHSPTTTPVHHLQIVSHVNSKPLLYGTMQRKQSFHHKLQPGTTTTFSGYTNVTGLPPRLTRRHEVRQPLLPTRQYQSRSNYEFIHGPTRSIRARI